MIARPAALRGAAVVVSVLLILFSVRAARGELAAVKPSVRAARGGTTALRPSVRAARGGTTALRAQPPTVRPRGEREAKQAQTTRTVPPDFGQMRRQQADTDRVWQEASVGSMQMEKVVYPSRTGDLQIPAFIFQPLQLTGVRRHPGLVWVHENIRGHLYEHYIPFIRQATARGFVVIAPEYRGSIGYGPELYDAIDYGGAEVDDVVAAVGALTDRVPAVDPKHIGIIGWSHGGMITLLSIFRNPATFAAAVAIVPVTNLFQRLAYKGIEEQRAQIDPNNRFGGTPAQRPSVYRERSPLFHVDKLRIPLRVHVADNDQDVNIEEGMQLIDALRARQPALAETEVFRSPAGGHVFDRRVDARTLQPENTPAQRESWEKVWGFFDRTLQLGASTRGEGVR